MTMTWRRVEKERSRHPSRGTYLDWKPELAEEGFHQCVYCAIAEASFGGIRNFHVEHYRPKSRFPALRNSYPNLFFACAICNTFKGDDWPREPNDDHSVCAYPDPSRYSYAEQINVDTSTFCLVAKTTSAKYLVERLYLNRPQLIIERRLQYALDSIRGFRNFFQSALPRLKDQTDTELIRSMLEKILRVTDICDSLLQSRPYTDAETKRAA
ncbi:MAG TPA: HNH endonuclease [Burkholderiales bacterium]|nr:HNH endonuclease [Burkholderiales bacterium]